MKRKWLSMFFAIVLILSTIQNAFIGTTEAATESNSDVINLVDSEASAYTKSLFHFLKNIGGEQVLFGHQHANDEGLTLTNAAPRTASEQSEVLNAVGDYPAIFGWDTGSLDGNEKPGSSQNTKEQNRTNLVASMKKAHELGGIIALSMHPDNFVTGGRYNDTSGNVVENILPGGSKNAEFNAWLDNLAALAHELKDDKGELIPIIFRPFHEQTGNWFWWGAHATSSDQYKAIFRYTVEYLRDKKDVSNILYGFSPGAGPGGDAERYLETYPGDDYVDIFGIDKYDEKNSAGSKEFIDDMVKDLAMISKLAEEKGKISAFTEYGYSASGMKDTGNNLEWYTTILDAIKANPDARKISYMQTWANFGWPNNMYVPYKDINGNLGGDHELLPNFTKFYNDEYSAFRNEIQGKVYKNEEFPVAEEKPFMHVVSPVSGSTIREATTKIHVRVLNDKPEKVVYVSEGSDTEHPMTLDNDGYYYTADYSPDASANGSSTHITIRVTMSDGTIKEETIKVFVKVPEIPVINYSFEENIDGFNVNDPNEATSATIDHAIVDNDGKLKMNVTGLESGGTWQELKLELTDLTKSELTAVNQVKFDAIVPTSLNSGQATLRGIAILPDDWDTKYGDAATLKNMSDLEKVEIDGVEYAKFSATIDLTNSTAVDEARTIAISLLGSGLNGDADIYFDNIQLLGTFTEAPKDPNLVDNYENYLGDDSLLSNSYTSAGDGVKVSLSSDHKNEGSYGLKYTYTLGSQGYAGATKVLGGVDWSDSNQIQFWIKPDGEGQRVNIQLMINGAGFEAYRYYEDTEATLETINFNEFVPASWADQSLRLTKDNLKNVSNFSVYVDANGKTLTSSLYFDDIKVSNNPDAPEVPDGDDIEVPEEPEREPLLYDFESGVSGWSIGYNENSATEPTTTNEGAINGSSLTSTFDLTGGKFSLQTTEIKDLSGEEFLSAKVKLSNGTADAKLYIQSGDWAWADSGAVSIAEGVQTITFPLANVANLNNIQAIGIEIIPTGGEGSTSVYVDDITLTNDTEDPETDPDTEDPSAEDPETDPDPSTEEPGNDPDTEESGTGPGTEELGTDPGTEDPSTDPGTEDPNTHPSNDSAVKSKSEGGKLPATATNQFNWMIAGFILLISGGITLFVKSRKKQIN